MGMVHHVIHGCRQHGVKAFNYAMLVISILAAMMLGWVLTHSLMGVVVLPVALYALIYISYLIERRIMATIN